MDPRYARIDTWIFDLDNCLYPASCDLFELIDERMTAYVQRLEGCDFVEARRIQKGHFHDHGTTLAGLMATRGINPHDFLDYVHDIDMDRLTRNPELAAMIARLPGRRLVFTNGDAKYAARVLDALGLGETFGGVHDIHATGLIPKPRTEAYVSLCDRFAIDPKTALFVEDMAKNLVPAHAMGMMTVWVDNGSEQAGHGPDTSFVDVTIADTAQWLREITGTDA